MKKCNAAKAVLRVKFTVLKAYNRKRIVSNEWSMLPPLKLEEEDQCKHKAGNHKYDGKSRYN